MAHLRCPYCNYRLFTPLATKNCPNCDKPLPGQFLPPSSAPGPESSNLVVRPLIQDEKASPDNNAATEPNLIFLNPIVNDTFPTKEQAWNWPGSRLPSLKGVVLHIQTQQDTRSDHDTVDVVGGVFKGIRDILWPVMETSRSSEHKTVVTQLIRLRMADGSQRDARWEGRLKGANIALGDEITLWGRYRKGTLIVRRAYNHTSEAWILPRRSSSSPLLLLISLVVLIVALYLLISSLHQFSFQF